MTSKRAYKLQEFLAHSSNVTSVKIGKKSSRLLATGGEDYKVNLWSIGKPKSILSLSGHTSEIASVDFDQSEVKLAAGAASGTVKLWDLEEAKIVRTLTGHRSSCISLDFHPFGEFFASGSSDTNLKIWDIRKKGCTITYKGHSKGINTIRFTPDGRWIVSGGEDNTVKVWDLTAGKLLHDFKFHEGQIESIDFHPSEFLLATGSADKTVKFWDLETFELIGSTSPESTGVRCMKFNPDGRTLLCGFHEALKVIPIYPFIQHCLISMFFKVFSWEPIRCHDSVHVGWSKLSDFVFHEGKLLACSHNQSCVGVWVVDIKEINNTQLESSLLKVSLCSDNANQNDVPEHSRTLIMPKKNNSKSPVRREINIAARTMPFSLRKSLISRVDDSAYPEEVKGSQNSDKDPVVDIMEPHEQFVGTMHSRLAKLQAVYRHWERRNMKAVIDVMEKMADDAVSADIISALSERMDAVTIETCAAVLPVLHALLGSSLEQHLSISMDMVLKLVRAFGSTIHSAWFGSNPVGVDIEAEQRMERYRKCFEELVKIKETMPSLVVGSGAVAKSALQLNLELQAFSCS